LRYKNKWVIKITLTNPPSPAILIFASKEDRVGGLLLKFKLLLPDGSWISYKLPVPQTPAFCMGRFMFYIMGG
jgi:hypothetical protein